MKSKQANTARDFKYRLYGGRLVLRYYRCLIIIPKKFCETYGLKTRSFEKRIHTDSAKMQRKKEKQS